VTEPIARHLVKTYMEMRREGYVVDVLGQCVDYRLKAGEACTEIFEKFMAAVMLRFEKPVIFEPFAGHTGESRTQNLADDLGIKLISFDLSPSDARVKEADSTLEGPGELIGGVIFHPPYYGSSSMSGSNRDLSNQKDKVRYMEMLEESINVFSEFMSSGGLVAAICRDYRHLGERIRLDHWMLRLYNKYGYSLIDVWISTPDMVLILEKKR